ncbi:UNVERIFIED_CONTAM: hypothetical protein RMT77_004883 [Armadillidium vulgare]
MFWFLFLFFFKIFAVLARDEGGDGGGGGGGRLRRNAYFDIQERDDFASDYDSFLGISAYNNDFIHKMKTYGKTGEEKLKAESPLKNLFFTRMRNSVGESLGKTNDEMESVSEKHSSSTSNDGEEIFSMIQHKAESNKESLIPGEDEEKVEDPQTSSSDSASIFMNPKLVKEKNLFSTKEEPSNYDFSYDLNVDTPRVNGKNLHAYKTNSDLFSKRSARHVRSSSMKLNSCHSQHLERCGSTLIKKFENVDKETVKCKIREEFLDCMVQERERKCQPPQENLPIEGINSIRSKVKHLLWSAHGCLLF